MCQIHLLQPPSEGALSQPAPATFFCPVPAVSTWARGSAAIIIRDEKATVVPSVSALTPGLDL